MGRGAERKIVQNTIFHGKRHDNKSFNVNFYCREICDPSDHLQESLGPPGPKSQKSLKKSLFGGLQKSPQKYPKKS